METLSVLKAYKALRVNGLALPILELGNTGGHFNLHGTQVKNLTRTQTQGDGVLTLNYKAISEDSINS